MPPLSKLAQAVTFLISIYQEMPFESTRTLNILINVFLWLSSGSLG
jgi:hypothetical protein